MERYRNLGTVPSNLNALSLFGALTRTMSTMPRLLSTLRHLYEGTTQATGIPLAEDVIFRDPIILLQGRNEVIRMFRRLNKLFPASSIQKFEALDRANREYRLLTFYRRHSDAPPRAFTTRLHIEHDHHSIWKITEHWIAPIAFSAHRGSGWKELARRGLGRLLS